MTKFLSYVIANDKFIHHPGVRKPGPKVTDIKKIKEFAPEVSFLSLPSRGPAHHQMEEASAGAQGPENCCSSSPCRFFFFLFLLIPFLLRISDAGSMILGRTTLVVCNVLRKDSIETEGGKRESKKQR